MVHQKVVDPALLHTFPVIDCATFIALVMLLNMPSGVTGRERIDDIAFKPAPRPAIADRAVARALLGRTTSTTGGG